MALSELGGPSDRLPTWHVVMADLSSLDICRGGKGITFITLGIP